METTMGCSAKEWRHPTTKMVAEQRDDPICGRASVKKSPLAVFRR
jgi:hypothetical protein